MGFEGTKKLTSVIMELFERGITAAKYKTNSGVLQAQQFSDFFATFDMLHASLGLWCGRVMM